MKEVEIIPIEYGKSVLSEREIFQGGAEDKFRPIVFMIYLINTQNRLILADAGCETMPGFDMHDFIGPIKAQGFICKNHIRFCGKCRVSNI